MPKPDPDTQLISVVVPAFDEEGNIKPLHEAVARALEGRAWELIVVDDGSTDSTYRRVVELSRSDDRVRGVKLSRNFGHQYALLAGLREARGSAVISMDADLQHPPELIPELLEAWRRGNRIVHTERDATSQVSLFKRLTSGAFYYLFSKLSGVSMGPGQSDFRLLDRRVVDTIIGLESPDLFLRGWVNWVGFTNTTIAFRAAPRLTGRSKYGFRSMVAFAIQGLTSFSTIPLRLGIALALLTSILAAVELVYVLFIAFAGEPVPGWASLAALLSALFSVAFLLNGFIGIYVGHIYSRIRGTPLYIVEETSEESNGPPE